MLTPPAYQGRSLQPALPAAETAEGDLVLEMASRLDAFSAYPFRT